VTGEFQVADRFGAGAFLRHPSPPLCSQNDFPDIWNATFLPKLPRPGTHTSFGVSIFAASFICLVGQAAQFESIICIAGMRFCTWGAMWKKKVCTRQSSMMSKTYLTSWSLSRWWVISAAAAWPFIFKYFSDLWWSTTWCTIELCRTVRCTCMAIWPMKEQRHHVQNTGYF